MRIKAVVTRSNMQIRTSAMGRVPSSVVAASNTIDIVMHPTQPLVVIHDKVGKTISAHPLSNFERIEYYEEEQTPPAAPKKKA